MHQQRPGMVNDGSTKGDQLVGLRFRDANLPQGVSIEKAYIQFSADEENSQLTQLNIHSEAADDAAVVSVNESISLRVLSSQVVPWSPAPWLTVNEVGPNQQTPDLAALVQEATDRSGWQQASALGFLISGSGKRVADSGDNVYYRAPYFYAEYSPAGGNQLPTAQFQWSCNYLDCSFNGSASSDPDGQVEDFSWEFGDGTSGTGVTVQHSYGAPGEYLVRLTVRDDQNASDTTSELLEISAPQGPAQDLAAADVATPGGSLSGDFTATHTQDDQYQTLSETHSGGKPSKRYDTRRAHLAL